MSSRFHNKYHRHNHHTSPINDPRYPDASHDPIASHESPFLGPFILSGMLSAVSTNLTGTAIQTIGSIQTTGSIQITQGLSAADINLTGNVVSTYSNPLIANGDFLQIFINGSPRYIRLWNFY